MKIARSPGQILVVVSLEFYRYNNKSHKSEIWLKSYLCIAPFYWHAAAWEIWGIFVWIVKIRCPRQKWVSHLRNWSNDKHKIPHIRFNACIFSELLMGSININCILIVYCKIRNDEILNFEHPFVYMFSKYIC